MTEAISSNLIELRVDNISQLFHTLDPFPFRERDLDQEAEGGYLIESPFRRLVEESFLILSWVANWRPLEIFLYDWLPLARKRDLYRRVARQPSS